ncbi:MAG: hypothetical protein R3D31_02605 [Hyphomicrobiaceae bacterium]
MASLYRHTQSNRIGMLFVLGIVLLIILLELFILRIAGVDVPVPILALATLVPSAILGLVAWVFSSLTIEVTDREVKWHFGPGVWRKQLALTEIRTAEAVKNKWWWGWGIRYTPHGWLYNVWGLDAVELRKPDGTALRLGTDDPQRLASAIARAARR